MMRNYVWLCPLLILALASCNAGVAQNAAHSAETPASVEQAAEASAKAPPEWAEASGTAETAQARDLTPEELHQWGDFLSQIDCYGFLMSSYETPLDADLTWVFYDGAGVGEYPTDEMTADFLRENGFEEAYTDITFIPYDAANEVLQRRTGYTLEHFRLSGNDIPLFYSQKYAGYFHMAGDTNRMLVECVSGLENADGSVFLKSREKTLSGDPDEFTSTFETILRPDAQGAGMVFVSNAVTGGWLTLFMEDEAEE